MAEDQAHRYTQRMASRSILVMLTLANLLMGCSVKISVSDAIVRRASLSEIQGDAGASSSSPEGAGVWALVMTTMSNEAVQAVARWEVYPHVYIVECSTGKTTNVGTEPRIESVGFGDFDAIRALVSANLSKLSYQMRSLIFVRDGDFRTSQCLQLSGGSYTGQKIVEERIPIRMVGSFP